MTENTQGRRVIARPDGRVEVESFVPRAPGPGEVLIRTEVTLISAGTELGLLDQPRSEDFCPGYSNVGRIVALGPGVTGVRKGDRVLSLGPHASHVTAPVRPETLAAVPEGLSSEEAAFGVLASVAAHGVRKARPELGEHVLLTGLGLVGQLALQYAALTGCETLTAADLSASRLARACEITNCRTVQPPVESIATAMERVTGGAGFDCSIEASGYPAVLPEIFDCMRLGGRVVLLGSIWHRKVELDLMGFHEKELVLLSAHQPKCPTVWTPGFPWTQGYNRAQSLRMMLDGRLKVRPLITHILPFSEAARAYHLLRADPDHALGVLLDFRTS